MKRHVIGERIPEQERQNSHAGGNSHGTKKDFDIDRVVKEFCVVLQIPVMDKNAVLYFPEAVSQHQTVRKEKEERHPGEGWKRDKKSVGSRVHC